MKLLLVLVLAVPVVLTGCSSAPVKTTQRQYCYTSQEIKTRNKETVSSETIVKCNDDPIEQIVIKKAGVASNCWPTKSRINLGGRYIEEVSIACQKFDGTWEVIPHPSLLN
jgi:hypothetical protein